MHRIIALVAVAALAVAACASADGRDDTPESLPVNDQTRSAPDDETPIPVEPDGGIGDGSAGEGLPVVSPDLAEEVDLAVSDLLGRLGTDRLIEVVVAHELTWPDASLGCPEPDTVYAQALVEGYRIELADGATTYAYHGELGSAPFLCE
jgi:hypothetical protein